MELDGCRDVPDGDKMGKTGISLSAEGGDERAEMKGEARVGRGASGGAEVALWV